MHDLIITQIKKLLQENDVVLFMKGTPEAPMCGFSNVVVQILKNFNIPFIGIDVLQDANLRQAIKEFSDWPTLPQLYIKQEFIGGADITKDMYNDGSLEALLKTKGIIS